MPIYRLADADLEVEDEGAYWVAPTAVLIGRIVLKRNASIWFGAVLRGDNEWIELGARSQIQDNAVLHTDLGFPLNIGEDCVIGHNVVLHGCTIASNSLIGMGAVVLNGARIGKNCLVSAGAVVTEGKEFPEHSLIIGAPARVIRTLHPAQVEQIGGTVEFYKANGPRFKKGLRRIG